MKFNTFHQVAAIAALISGLGLAPLAVQAANNDDIDASISIVGALSATTAADMNFGTWYYIDGSSDTTWVKDTAGSVVATPGSGATAQLVGAANTTPARIDLSITGATSAQNGTSVTMTVGAPGAFNNDTDAALSDITYKVGAGSELSYTVPVGVTIADATTPTPIYFGATITATDTLTTGTNTSTFNVSFAY